MKEPTTNDYLEALFVLLTRQNDHGDFKQSLERCPNNPVIQKYAEQRRVEKEKRLA